MEIHKITKPSLTYSMVNEQIKKIKGEMDLKVLIQETLYTKQKI